MMLAKNNEEEMAKQGIPAGLNIQAIQAQAQQQGMAEGGIAELTPEDGKMLSGNGDGVSDDIPAMIDRIQAARKQTMGNDKQYAKDTNAERFLPV